MEVWIVECDHKPLLRGIRPICFAGREGTYQMRQYLNRLPTDDGHYYDAVLYGRKADHLAKIEEMRAALRKCERCLTELYPSEPCKPEHEAEYYAVNAVLNEARAALDRK